MSGQSWHEITVSRESRHEATASPTKADGFDEAADGRLLNIPLEFGRGNLNGASIFSSVIDPIETLLAEHLEDDAAEVSAEGADGLIVFLAFGAFFLVVALRLRHTFAMVIDGGHHRCLGAGVDMLWHL